MDRASWKRRYALAAWLLASPLLACTGVNPNYEVGVDSGTDPARPQPQADAAPTPPHAPPPTADVPRPDGPLAAPDTAPPPRDASASRDGPADLAVDAVASESSTVAPPDAAVAGPNRASLLGWWPLDDGPGATTARDASGNGRHGMLEALDSATAWVIGRVGSHALRMPGGASNAGVRIPIDPAVDAMRAFTIAAWFKRPSFPTMIHKSVFSRQLQAGSSQELFNISCNGNDVIIYIPGEGSQVYKEARGTGLITQTDRWYHAAGTYDGSTLRLYVDGELAAEKLGFTNRLTSSSTDLYIGTNKNATVSDVFDGTVDDVVLFNKALPASVIRELYRGSPPTGL